jgi:hypothetical protein
MAAFNKFQKFAAYMPNGAVNLASDTIKVLLTNTSPNLATAGVYSDISATELTGSTGYAAGGATVTVSASTQSSGTYKLVASMANPTWTAGATWNPFQYAVMYDSSASTKALIGMWDYGSALVLSNTQTFTITLDAVNGVFQLS